MRRLLVPMALLVAVGIVAGGLALALSSRTAGEAEGLRPRSSLSVVSVAVRPPVHTFGEPIVAEVVLLGDSTAIRPETVRIATDFAPYEPTAPVQVVRTETGSAVRWRFRYALRCLREGCAPANARRSFEFPLTNVVYSFRSTPGPATAIVDWPSFEVAGRVDAEALSGRTWRADVTTLPAVTYRWAPGGLAAALLSVSAALAALGFGLVWWFVRRLRPGVAEALEPEEETHAAPLFRALQLAQEASRNGDSPERRKALERTARELVTRDLPRLAERARALAWASGSASSVAVDDLVRDVHAATNGTAA